MHKRVIGGKTYEQHVESAKAAGISLGHYAREHDLQVGSLYSASKRLRAKARTLATTPLASPSNDAALTKAFVPVNVTSTVGTMKARLPNGVELECSGIDASSWSSMLQALSSLPCSR